MKTAAKLYKVTSRTVPDNAKRRVTVYLNDGHGDKRELKLPRAFAFKHYPLGAFVAVKAPKSK